MLNAIKRFFDDRIIAEPVNEPHRVRLATAALLVEMTRQDEHVAPAEREAVERALTERFELDAAEAQQLMQLAEAEAGDASGYFQFTSLINDSFSMPEKIHMIELLWRVAAVDGRVDRYEEHMVRRVADLLYVPHGDFIAAKLRVLK